MMNKEQIELLINNLNLKRQVSFKIQSEQPVSFSGNVKLPEETVCLKIEFTEYFPLEFPTISIENAQRFYPHVSVSGRICLFDDSSLLIRSDMPEQMVIDAFDRAKEILNVNPLSIEYRNEVAKEFNAYWSGVSKLILYTNLSPCKSREYLNLSAIRAENKILVSNSVADSEFMLKNHFKLSLEEESSIPCIQIRLREFNIPPIQKKYNWKWLRRFVLKNITSSQKKDFTFFLTTRKKVFHQFLILSIPTDNQDICVAFLIYAKSNKYKKIEKMVNCTVIPVTTIPIDYNFLVKRSSARTELSNRSVLLLGGGSVGGYIASNLCQAGICNVDILDRDKFTVENVYRHLLGFGDALKGRYKADLLKEYLEEQYPFVDIDSLDLSNRRAESFIQDSERIQTYDLIISALGEPTINLEINRILYSNNINIPFVICFNEPYGIGGHVIAVNLQSGGCLRCLYTDLISNNLVPFRASLVAEGQNFKKSISGCAGSFVEYTALDSQQTALLTVRLVIDILSGRCNESTLLSWTGTSDNLIDNGFKVSDYYKHISSQNYCNTVKKYIPTNERCPICVNAEV